MNRRSFLSLFSAGVAGLALEQAIPLGRVWSFPKEIVIAPPLASLDWPQDFPRRMAVGSTVRIRFPQRFLIRDYIGDFSQPPRYGVYVATPEGLEPTAAFLPDSSRTPS